ncbi:PREDICTED: chromodomain-helicase-DNA-binding protein 1-like [Amphimedon queenslandica]|uniref:Uncharacterized protein n=1 Tax=Amphimedon queenslandica TaxID=400682 RepID=A0AAN0JTY3_AMPQE|nr:PREDICTED: chromodomain-helicase-DNA-binding protein 1-like [Amphimedon queenslandica]|eukprot:XP_019860353.1 PREDICTED: chromodomain-helicase-DNA-binding protein 1-like [Amphimedon queenslandica]
MESEESSFGCEDLESIIGETDANGHWIIQDTAVPEALEGEGEEEQRGPETIYMYEGRDYSKVDEKDQKTFEELLSG